MRRGKYNYIYSKKNAHIERLKTKIKIMDAKYITKEIERLTKMKNRKTEEIKEHEEGIKFLTEQLQKQAAEKK